MAIYRGTGDTGTGSESDFASLVEDAQQAAASAEQSALDASGFADQAEQAYDDTVAIYGSISAVNAAVTAAQLAETNAETAELNAEQAEANAEGFAAAALVSKNAAAASALAAAEDAADAEAAANNPYVITVGSDLAGNGFAYDMGLITDVAVPNPGADPGFIETVAVNIDDVIECADNISAIIAAQTYADSASTSATNASASASSAATSATNASNSATTATTQATNASNSATAASSSASAASTSATNAASSASSATISASNAASSATAAATSATNASNSATAASSSAASAAASYDSFDDRYLGPKATAPTVDNDGNTLLVGALYFNTTSNQMKVWDGSSWLNAYASLSGALLSSNNLSDVANTTTSRTNLGAAASGANTDITSLSGITGGVGTADYYSLDTAAGAASAVGRISWDDGNGTAQIGLKGGNVTLQVGQELIARVYNDSGVSLTDGQIVYISGAHGNRIAVKLANAASEATSAGTLGMVTEPIASGAEGFITIMGTVNGLNTTGLTAGALVYLSTTNGAYTTTAPTAPNHRVILGYVERVHATVGSIYVKVDNGYELDELHNVLFSSVANGDVIVYNNSTNVWENKAQSNIIAGGVTAGSITSSMLASTLDLGVLA